MGESNLSRIALVCAIALISASCLTREEYSPEEIDRLIQVEVDRRVAEYIAVRTTFCAETLLSEATRRLDSMQLEEARTRRDTLLQPAKPERPEKPTFRTLSEDIPLVPLLQPKDTLK